MRALAGAAATSGFGLRRAGAVGLSVGGADGAGGVGWRQ